MTTHASGRLDPVTRKRWNRFRKIKRAYWSLCLLSGLYGVSLVSELICNDRPLYVRFNGASYFPFLFYYPDDVFTGSGRKTRPDYKRIHASPAFRASNENVMIFAPVPFGPYEIIDAETLPVSPTVTGEIRLMPRVGTLNIGSDLLIQRSRSAGFFFACADTDVDSRRLTDVWEIGPELRQAIDARFANQAADFYSTTVTSRRDPTVVAEFSLSTYEPRESAPQSIRITLRESGNDAEASHGRVVFADDGTIRELSAPVWYELSAAERERISGLARARFTGAVEPVQLQVGTTEYELRLAKNEIQWPFSPIAGHWLGIDNAGRDVLARILYGWRISMTFGLLLVVCSMAIGIVIGAVQGYYSGIVDISCQRMIEIWTALPFLYVMILLGSIYGRSFVLLLVLYGIFNWVGISYYVRAEFLKLRRQPFVESAICAGLPASRIIFRHILPNALVPVITFFPFSLVGAIGSLAALDYLGFGLPPPTPSWGELLSQAQQFRWAWWLILYPSLALFVVMLLGVFVGEGVREAFDPRRYSRLR